MPAYRRYALSEITFAQRRLMCSELATNGIKADCVVIADDENLDIAKLYGFHTVEQNNEYLGRRFNDGHELASKLGFDFTVPVGSDMFLDSQLFVRLQDKFTITNYYAIVKTGGGSIATLFVEWGILQIIPTRLMKPLEFRPCTDEIIRGCDTLTRKRIKSLVPGKILEIAKKKVHQYECVSFQSKTQLTSFDGLVNTYEADVLTGDPGQILAPLREWYSETLVDAVQSYYLSGTSEKL